VVEVQGQASQGHSREQLPELKNASPSELAERIKSLRTSKRDLEASLYETNLHIEATSQVLLEWMEASNLTKIELRSGGLIFIQDEPYCKVSDMDALRKWIKGHKLGNLLSIHWQTLNSMTKDALIDGKPLPSGVEVFMKSSLRLRGGKDSNGEAADEE
jgi:hypothetical protein